MNEKENPDPFAHGDRKHDRRQGHRNGRRKSDSLKWALGDAARRDVELLEKLERERAALHDRRQDGERSAAIGRRGRENS